MSKPAARVVKNHGILRYFIDALARSETVNAVRQQLLGHAGCLFTIPVNLNLYVVGSISGRLKWLTAKN